MHLGAIDSSNITISVDNSTLTLGQSVHVRGEITPEGIGIEVTLTYTKPDGSTLTRKTVTSLKSTYVDVYAPDKAGAWAVVASWSGNDRYSGASSSSVSFTISELPTGASDITCMTYSQGLILGGNVTIFGRLIPAGITLVTIEKSADGGLSWSLLTTTTSAADGTYQYVWTPSATGSYLLRARWVGDSSHSAAISTTLRVAVHSLYVSDFSISVIPSSQTISAGQTATFTITIALFYGFNSPVFLNSTGLPTAATASFSPQTISTNGTSTLTITTSASMPVGTANVTISGAGGGRIRSVQIFLVVTSTTSSSSTSTPQCLIATATYGSELARRFNSYAVSVTIPFIEQKLGRPSCSPSTIGITLSARSSPPILARTGLSEL